MATLSSNNSKYQTIKFDAISFVYQQRFGKFMWETMEVNIEDTLRDILIGVRTYIMGQHNYQQYKVSVHIPKNWWEHFKQDHAPKWYLKKFPVKEKAVTRTIEFDHKKIFPESNIVPPDKFGPVYFHSHTDDPYTYK